MRLRSVLFVPCGNPKAMAKAATLTCDALIFDLEDAVGDSERKAALLALSEALKRPIVAKNVLVRLHPLHLDAIHEALDGVAIDGLVVPKVGDPDDLAPIRKLWPDMAVWAMIETARGVANLRDIATCGLTGLIAGPNDLRKDLRTRPMPERQDILLALSQIVLHGRANDLFVLDGVYNNFRDEGGFSAECQQGRSLGFDGKTLIHPAQIDTAKAAFSPSETEIAWAKAVISAFDGNPAGVLSVSGEMVERLHLEQAEAILARAV
ncbi:MAG: CoA ester lyase [Asticcacaulis sp.]